MRAGLLLIGIALDLVAGACGAPAPARPDAGPGGADPPGSDGGEAATCEHPVCASGPPLAAGCSSCVDRVCAADAACCADGWSEACVLEAAIACDETCPATGEPLVDSELRDSARRHAPTAASHTVTPVLFVPADLADQELVEPSGRLFAELAREGQGLYWHVIAGRTFALEPLATVTGAHDSAFYGDSGSVRAEVTAAIGRENDGTEGTWILWYGGGGEAGAYAAADWNPAIGYTAVLGEGSLFSHLAYVTGESAWCGHIIDDGFRAECEEPSWIITAGMGAFVHELGHTFGLGHEDDHAGQVPPNSFMSAHWNYFHVRSPDGAAGALSETYKERLRASPFFSPRR